MGQEVEAGWFMCYDFFLLKLHGKIHNINQDSLTPDCGVMTKRSLSTLDLMPKALLFSSMNLLKSVRRKGV